MILFNANVQTSYSVTPRGNYVERVVSRHGMIMRSSPNPLKMLGWMIEGPAKTEKRNEAASFRMMKIIGWWEMIGGDQVRGGFDLEHYKKVLEARKNGNNN